jgi:hypothetical protein
MGSVITGSLLMVLVFFAIIAAIVWLLLRFRHSVSKTITSTHKISERQFWFEPISTREQALSIIKRSSRDFIGLSILSLFGVTWSALFLLISAFLLGRKNKVAAFFLLAYCCASTVLIIISTTKWVMNPELFNDHPGATKLVVPLLLLSLAIYGATNWMAWRAFQAIRVAARAA